MTAGAWFLTNSLAGVYQQLSETDPGAEAYASPTTGWIGGTGSTNRSEFRPQVERASSTFNSTAYPDGSLDTASGDGFRTQGTYCGNFASGNWVVHVAVRANTQTGCSGRMHVRVFRSESADGSAATEITAGDQAGATVTSLATGTTQDSSATFNPGAVSLASQQYLFFQIAWERTGGGGMTTSDIDLRVGNGSGNGTRVTAPAFSAAVVALTGTFAETGQAAGLAAQRKLTADAGAFAETGQDAGLSLGTTMAVSPGNFTLTGEQAELSAAPLISASTGSFTLSGQDAGLGAMMPADTAALALSGQGAALTAARAVPADAGSYVIGGADAALSASRFLAADSGAFSCAAQDAALAAHRTSPAEAGALSLVGQDAGLPAERRLPAVAGSSTAAGQVAELLASRVLPASAGGFSVTGYAAGLIHGTAGSYFLLGDAGDFAASGSATPLLADRVVSAETAAALLSGEVADLRRDASLSGGTGALSLTCADASLRSARALGLSHGALFLAGQGADLAWAGAPVVDRQGGLALSASPTATLDLGEARTASLTLSVGG